MPIAERLDTEGGGLSFAAAFSPALLDPQSELPTVVTGPNEKIAIKRYNVYRNNVTVSLINALAAIFPATERITGVEFFRAMARFHIRATPPTSPLLFEYGRDFPGFIERYEYARPMPWLADIARLERAWLDAYHAADRETLTSEALAAIPSNGLADAIFVPHPATRIFRSNFAAVSIFAANRTEAPVGPIEAIAPEDALITRPGLDVVVRRLPEGGAVFLTHLVLGETLGEAAAAAFEAEPLIRSFRQYRRDDRSGRVYGNSMRRSMRTTANRCAAASGAVLQIGMLADRLTGMVRFIAQPSLVQLVLRFGLAVPFWRSGILKWDGFLHLNDAAVDLFTSEFMLHLPGGPYPYPAPATMAFLSGCAEIVFPVLLVFGFATRFAATGLLFMTSIVELTVPDGWPVHITWAAMALGIMAWGPGRLSIDYGIRRVTRSVR